MVVFAVNPKESEDKVLESMNESRKAVGYNCLPNNLRIVIRIVAHAGLGCLEFEITNTVLFPVQSIFLLKLHFWLCLICAFQPQQLSCIYEFALRRLLPHTAVLHLLVCSQAPAPS